MRYNLSKTAIEAIESILNRGYSAKVESSKDGVKVMSLRTKVEFLDRKCEKSIESQHKM